MLMFISLLRNTADFRYAAEDGWAGGWSGGTTSGNRNVKGLRITAEIDSHLANLRNVNQSVFKIKNMLGF
jgi:hypothetical protein